MTTFQQCGISNIKNVVDFVLRTRLCGNCARFNLFPAKYLNTEDQLGQLVLKCIPFSEWDNDTMKSCLIKDKQQFVKKLNSSNCLRQEFVDKSNEEVKARVEHGRQCHAWLEEGIKEGEARLEQIRTKRKEAICDKLRPLGYGAELDYLWDLEQENFDPFEPFTGIEKHRLVRVAEPLTELVWTNIKDRMIQYMERVKTHIASEDRLELVLDRKDIILRSWRAYRREHAEDRQFMPSVLDIWEEFKDIIELPSEQTLTEQIIKENFDNRMQAYLQRFRETEREILADRHTSEEHHPQASGIHKLTLATCVFACNGNHMAWINLNPKEVSGNIKAKFQTPLFYPEFLHHPCNSITCRQRSYDKYQGEIRRLDEDVDLSVDKIFEGYRRDKWSSKMLVPHDKASQIVAGIVEACGLDPSSTTVKMMDMIDPRLICLKCSYGKVADGEREFPVRSWRKAVVHCLKKHWASVSWQCVAADDANRARELESARPAKGPAVLPQPLEAIWRCTRCLESSSDDGAMTLEELANHYQTRHHKYGDTGKLEESRHFYRALEWPPVQKNTVRIVPKVVPNLQTWSYEFRKELEKFRGGW